MTGVFCDIINPALTGVIIPLLFAASFIAFIWGVFYYAIAGEYDEYCREMSKGLMLWSVLAFIVMAAVWGLVTWIYGAAGVSALMCR